MDGFLTKPFEPAARIEMVHRCLERKPAMSLPIAAIEQATGPAPIVSASSQIDSTVAQAVFGKDTALFVSLLARLVRDFSGFALPVSVDPHDGVALNHLMGRLHKLGGGAGLIGATTVHRLAGAAEAALAAGEAPNTIDIRLQQLAAAFTALAEEVALMIAAATVANHGPLAAAAGDLPRG